MNADERKVRFHIEHLEERIAPGNLKVDPPGFINPLGDLTIPTNQPTHGLSIAEGHTNGVITWTS